MPLKERFEFSERMGIAGKTSCGFRLWGDFTPHRCALSRLNRLRTTKSKVGRSSRLFLIGSDAARELGKLGDCLQRVERTAAINDDYQQRARVVTKLLLRLEQGDALATDADWEMLFAFDEARKLGGSRRPLAGGSARGTVGREVSGSQPVW